MAIALGTLCLARTTHAASVGPAGYTNSFNADPPVGDWATFSRRGSQRDVYEADADVNATISANAVTDRTTATWMPVWIDTNAMWVFTGCYLQTRPSGNRYTALMNKLVNNSGTNATEIVVSYLFSVGTGEPETLNLGTRVYFSLTGQTNSWTNLVTLNVTNVDIGPSVKSTNLVVNWPNGENLYLLWIDDNTGGQGGNDAPNRIDDFFVAVVRGRSANILPSVAITAPSEDATFFEPAAVPFEVSATHPDAIIKKVEFFANSVKVGEDESEPYGFTWPDPPIGQHVLRAIATDEQGKEGTSAPVNVLVLDSVGTPFAHITKPPDGFVSEGPVNLVISATAGATNSVAQVEFLANGTILGNDTTPPFEIAWTPPFGTNLLTAITVAGDGQRGTSAVVEIAITIPPSNTVAPVIVAQNPSAGSIVSNLTSIQVTFSERVIDVDASDLLINGVPALNVSGDAAQYTFSFAEPIFGTVTIGWAAQHGITDGGYPARLAFDHSEGGATWSYLFVDHRPPVITGQFPDAGVTVSNLTETTISFSEPVTGVDATDLLINDIPAVGVVGAGSNYTFSFTQPRLGRVGFSWNTNHGIADFATSSNSFNATNRGAAWTVTLNSVVVLIESNSPWLFIKGTTDPSTPIDAWRQFAFDDSGWSNAWAPFFYGDPYSDGLTNFTLLSDMEGSYSTIYLRKKFDVSGASALSNVYLHAQFDDGIIAWINGREVRRVASDVLPEPQNRGADYFLLQIINPSTNVLQGENVLAIQAYNNTSSAHISDFGFNAQLLTLHREVILVTDMQRQSSSELQMRFSANPGWSYVVERSSDLAAWVAIATNTAAASTVTFTDRSASPTTSFYRLKRSL